MGSPQGGMRLRALRAARGRFEFASRWVPEGSQRLLDVGCSAGHFTQSFADRVEHLYGADTDEEALAAGARDHPGIAFLCCTGARLPFADGSFDAILLMEVVEHLADGDKRELLNEAYRLLAPGGLLVLTTVHAGAFAWLDPMDFKRRCPAVYRLYTRLSGYRPNTPADIGHRHLSAAELDALLGPRFLLLERQYSGLLLLPLTLWARAILGRLRLLPGFLDRWLRLLGALEERFSFGRASYFVRLAAKKPLDAAFAP